MCGCGWVGKIFGGDSMCKFPYSILIVYYGKYTVILLYIIEYYRYITDVIVMM